MFGLEFVGSMRLEELAPLSSMLKLHGVHSTARYKLSSMSDFSGTEANVLEVKLPIDHSCYIKS